MRYEDLKIDELYIWSASTITIDKITSINNNFVKVQMIKSILGDYQTGKITNYDIDFFCQNWRELTRIEKLKYL